MGERHRMDRLNLYLPVLLTFLIVLLVLLFCLPVYYCSKTDKSEKIAKKLEIENIFQKLNSTCKEISIEKDLPYIKDGQCVILKINVGL